MGPSTLIDLAPGRASRSSWFRDLLAHRGVILMLARKDFQVRYKRASLGVLWAVATPLLQALVLTVVFSRFVADRTEVPYGPYVFSGVVAWSYFVGTTNAATTAIVDGASLTDKIWFPRAALPLVPALSGLVGLGISMALLVATVPLLGGSLGAHTLLLLPAALLVAGFTASVGLVLSALQVYFRDVRFLVAAALLVLLYCTPILYTKDASGDLGRWLDFNPLTGVVALFQFGAVGVYGDWAVAVSVSIATTVVAGIAAVEIYRRHDRLFVDLL